MKCPECGGENLLVWECKSYPINPGQVTFFKDPQLPELTVTCQDQSCDISEEFEIIEEGGGFGKIEHIHHIYECPCGAREETNS